MQMKPTVLYFVLSDAILKHELRVIIKQWTAPELTKTMCTQGPSAHFSAWVQGRPCLNSSLGTWKKGVFTFMPSEYCTRAPCLGTKCERCLNPLSPKRDQPEISPYNINALENIVVMRIEYMIREDESNWYFNKFSPVLLLKEYRDSKWESQF